MTDDIRESHAWHIIVALHAEVKALRAAVTTESLKPQVLEWRDGPGPFDDPEDRRYAAVKDARFGVDQLNLVDMLDGVIAGIPEPVYVKRKKAKVEFTPEET